jgi:hypothetical protein
VYFVHTKVVVSLLLAFFVRRFNGHVMNLAAGTSGERCKVLARKCHRGHPAVEMSEIVKLTHCTRQHCTGRIPTLVMAAEPTVAVIRSHSFLIWIDAGPFEHWLSWAATKAVVARQVLLLSTFEGTDIENATSSAFFRGLPRSCLDNCSLQRKHH